MLLEREREQAELQARIEVLAATGQGAVVLVEGVAGIGKSRLLAAAAEHARAAGLRVLAAHGTELEFELAFGGARQLFTAPLLALQDEREQLLAGPAALAAPVLGIEEEREPHGLADPLHGLFWLTANLTLSGPVALLVDDLHWLDQESARFVVYLGRRLAGLPLLLLVTARPEGDAAAGLADVAETLTLAPLSPDAVATLSSRPDAFELTGGNPFLVAELERAGPRGSPNVARSVLRRAERAGQEAVELARAVALFADGATLADAVAVSGLPPEAAADAADALVAAEVLADEPVLRFLHPLMRSAVYDTLGPFARRRGHRRAADTLRTRNAAPEQIAAHLLAGDPAGDEANVDVLEAAAATALRGTAPRAAARYLERALLEPPSAPERRARIGLELGRLQAMTGRPEAEVTLRAALAEATDPQLRADLAIEFLAAAYENLHYADGLAGLRAAEPLEAGRDETLIVDALRLVIATAASGAEQDAAAAIARIPPDLPGDTPAERLALVALAAHRFEHHAPASDVLDLLHRSLDEEGPYATACGSLADPSDMLIKCGDLVLAQSVNEEQAERARETGNLAEYAAAQFHLADIALQRGEFRSAEAAAMLAIEAPGASPSTLFFSRSVLLWVRMLQGRLDEAEAVLAEVTADGSHPARYWAASSALVAATRGEHERALPGLLELDAVYARDGRVTPSMRLHLQQLAPTLAALGRRDEAIALVREWLAESERFGAPLPLGTAHMELGRLLGGSQEGREHWLAARDVFEHTQYGWNIAWCRAEVGAILRRENQAREARALLEQALDYATREDVRSLAAFAEGELRLTGARPRRKLLSGVESLTPSEHRIAALAAEGRSNREIAQHLFLTLKTVEGHLSRAYRKLDIGSRAELAEALVTQAAD